MHIKRLFLVGIIVSLAIAAAAGVWAILFGGTGPFTEQIIGSMLAVALACGIAMTAFDVMDKGYGRIAMFACLGLCALSLAGILLLIWFGNSFTVPEPYIKGVAMVTTWAIALALAGQMVVLKLPRSLEKLQWAEVAVIWLLAAWITAALIVEPEHEWYYQTLGVIVIAMAFGAVALRVVQRIAKVDEQQNIESTPLRLLLTCPRCLTMQEVDTGPSRCRKCRLRFQIEIEEPRCPGCGYLLHELTSPKCPECGRGLDPEELPANAAGAEAPRG